jgi:hypothetical protein
VVCLIASLSHVMLSGEKLPVFTGADRGGLMGYLPTHHVVVEKNRGSD